MYNFDAQSAAKYRLLLNTCLERDRNTSENFSARPNKKVKFCIQIFSKRWYLGKNTLIKGETRRGLGLSWAVDILVVEMYTHGLMYAYECFNRVREYFIDKFWRIQNFGRGSFLNTQF